MEHLCKYPWNHFTGRARKAADECGTHAAPGCFTMRGEIPLLGERSKHSPEAHMHHRYSVIQYISSLAATEVCAYLEYLEYVHLHTDIHT